METIKFDKGPYCLVMADDLKLMYNVIKDISEYTGPLAGEDAHNMREWAEEVLNKIDDEDM